MSLSRPSNNNRCDDLPIAVATIAMSLGKGNRVGCVLTDMRLFSVGNGEGAELDAVASFGTALAEATLYSTRLPEDLLMKFLEKCGLRRIVILQTGPDGHNGGRGPIFIEYVGSATNRVRDMVLSISLLASAKTLLKSA